MVNSLGECKTLTDLDLLLQRINHTEIGRNGGRKIVILNEDSRAEHSLNQVAKKFLSLCSKSDYSNEDVERAFRISEKLTKLNSGLEYKKGLSTRRKKVNLAFRRTMGGTFFGHELGLKLLPKNNNSDALKSLAFNRMFRKYQSDVQKMERRTGHIGKMMQERPKFITTASLEKITGEWEEIDRKILYAAKKLETLKLRKILRGTPAEYIKSINPALKNPIPVSRFLGKSY